MKEPGRLAGLFFLADARTRSQAIALMSVNVSGATEVCADIHGVAQRIDARRCF